MYGYGYGSAIDSLGVNKTPMCDFQTWYQTYYPLYAQMYGTQAGTPAGIAAGTTTSPNFRGADAPIAQAQSTEEPEKKGKGGLAIGIISSAALIAGGIACYRKGNAKGAKTFWEKLTKGFSTYKNKGLAKISTHKLVDKGVVDKLPEGTTLKANNYILANNGEKQIYNLITEGENKGKYRLRERTRKWFWQSEKKTA